MHGISGKALWNGNTLWKCRYNKWLAYSSFSTMVFILINRFRAKNIIKPLVIIIQPWQGDRINIDILVTRSKKYRAMGFQHSRIVSSCARFMMAWDRTKYLAPISAMVTYLSIQFSHPYCIHSCKIKLRTCERISVLKHLKLIDQKVGKQRDEQTLERERNHSIWEHWILWLQRSEGPSFLHDRVQGKVN